MTTGPFFSKAWQRRAYYKAELLRERELERNASIIPRTRLAPKPEPPKSFSPSQGHYIKPLEWTPEERQRLNAWRRDCGSAISTERGLRTLTSAVHRHMQHNR